ncbi:MULTISPECIES: phosphopantetheine-binding protein [unclassified Neisseria]|uniref:phosphopantetheine-binding protein n=1 Tax=unclassified Neisseria TaxID=2623750 RepID=UPI002667022E|nr:MULTISPECIES: phosphopantetheine-binding protein [unclassified Neisseria]MDO1508878.1 phosphopantetheine-binding protein [Neisseria sp. MVDL19-042950]MDO1515137.1 phosphopantetheine-binding protein [Neisseria sp. MVDL18-041461]MDO1562497.1 phosphopantetheine-binding protein [Neisseria sp. MVDL20-010259]
MGNTVNTDSPALERELKLLIARESERDDLDIDAWQDDEPLFGRKSSIGLDSLDALQISVALQARYGVRLNGDRMVRKHMMTVRDLAAFIRAGQTE